MYVLPDSHGAGVSAALMAAALSTRRDLDAKCVWLGVNQQNNARNASTPSTALPSAAPRLFGSAPASRTTT